MQSAIIRSTVARCSKALKISRNFTCSLSRFFTEYSLLSTERNRQNRAVSANYVYRSDALLPIGFISISTSVLVILEVHQIMGNWVKAGCFMNCWC